MALQCQLSINAPSVTAGQSPPPAVTLTVYNPNAVAVSVLGVDLVYLDMLNAPIRFPSAPASVAPIGVGQTTSVPPLGTITIGPFPIIINTVANANPFTAVAPGSSPGNPQGAMPNNLQLQISARVTGSDGSINIAGVAGLIVSPTSQPPPGYQGGVAQFQGVNNSNLIAAVL